MQTSNPDRAWSNPLARDATSTTELVAKATRHEMRTPALDAIPSLDATVTTVAPQSEL